MLKKWGNDSRKIFAHEYIDDKATNPVKERAWIRRLRKAKAEKLIPAAIAVVSIFAAYGVIAALNLFILRKETRNMAKRRKQDGKLPLLWSEFDHRRWRRHDSAAAGRSGNNAMHMRKGYGIPRNGEQKNRGKTESRRTVRKKTLESMHSRMIRWHTFWQELTKYATKKQKQIIITIKTSLRARIMQMAKDKIKIVRETSNTDEFTQ